MLVGLVTGVYTFGLVGVLLGPMVIGLLKAIIDTISATSTWRLLDDDEAASAASPSSSSASPASPASPLPPRPIDGSA
jgi:hypothetical protein